ncbi:PREDICTED: cytochrome P450 2J2-like [Branchiostoma belcheri]|uniref:Cytochrome P450 2J2-like n=1 Tax=Branchiostoma belcheri TaxID=7741 RepID=A0A6P4Y9X7_BRABE|nr:PREDICTED: cytochrome P450 2J2-like [Branchiostoma belcheri]
MADTEFFALSRLSFQTILVLSVSFLLAYLFLRRPRNLPPYPAGWWPFFGHLLALGRAPHLKLTAWRRQYGDVFTVRLGMTDVVVLNGYKAVKDALVHRSDLFASRPPNYTFDFITGFGKGLATARWGHGFKQKKKFTTSALKTLGMKVGKGSVEDKIREEARCLCDKVAEYGGNPFDVEEDLRTTVANVLVSMVIGNRFDYGDERFRELSEAMVGTLVSITAGQLVSLFPFLRFVPYVNKSYNDTIKYNDNILKLLREEISRHRRDLDRENPRDFIDYCLVEVDNHDKVDNLTEENVMYFGQELFFGGIDTTFNTLRWSLLYMVLNPDVQRKVQTELDAVVGGTSPTLSHRSQLPYTEATLAEVQRIRTVVALGLPHATTQQVTVAGFDVPAGTQVIMNLYSLHVDAVYWPDPEKFDPGRFLNAEGHVMRNLDSFMPFSGGRRVCPGEQLAKMELFLLFSSLLQHFTFKLPEGAPPLSTEGILAITLTTHSYKLCAVPR